MRSPTVTNLYSNFQILVSSECYAVKFPLCIYLSVVLLGLRIASKSCQNSIQLNSYYRTPWHIKFELKLILCKYLKVRQSRNDFFKPTFPPKNEQTNSTLLHTMKPQVDLLSFIFWRILKAPKRYFEIN